jgi:Flp pilus assembly CpaE family ATPase
VNLGRLLHDVDKRSPTAVDLGAAVELVSGDAPRAAAGAARKPLWGLFGG